MGDGGGGRNGDEGGEVSQIQADAAVEPHTFAWTDTRLCKRAILRPESLLLHTPPATS